MKKIYISLAPLVLSALVGCGGSSSGGGDNSMPNTPPSNPNLKRGVFLDSEVIGIGYKTPTLEGITNGMGEFQYSEGETVTFFIGSIELPAVQGADVVTPFDIAGSTDTSNPTVVNIARLLQSLDEDGNTDNGIEIPDSASNIAQSAIDFAQSIADFALNSNVINLVANSGSVNTTLISENNAINHLENTVNSTPLISVAFDPSKFAGQTVYEVTESVEGSCEAFPDGSSNCSETTTYEKGTFTFNANGTISVSDSEGEFFTGTYNFSDENKRLNLIGTFDNGDITAQLDGYILAKSYNATDDVYSICFINLDPEPTGEQGNQCNSDLYSSLFVFDEAQADTIVSNNSYTPSP